MSLSERLSKRGAVKWWQWLLYSPLVAGWVIILVLDFNYRLASVGSGWIPLWLDWTLFALVTLGGAVILGFTLLGLGLHAILQLSDDTRTYHP